MFLSRRKGRSLEGEASGLVPRWEKVRRRIRPRLQEVTRRGREEEAGSRKRDDGPDQARGERSTWCQASNPTQCVNPLEDRSHEETSSELQIWQVEKMILAERIKGQH